VKASDILDSSSATEHDTEQGATHPVAEQPVSNRYALAFVYGGYSFRYLYLLILIPFFGLVLGAAEYGKVLAAMSLFNVVWLVVEYGFPIVGARDVASMANKVALGAAFGRQIKARLLMSVVGVAIGAVGTISSPVMRAEPAFGLIATTLGIVAAFNLGWYFGGTHRFRTLILMEMAGFAMNSGLILSMVHDSGDGLLVLLSLLASGLIITAVSYVIAVSQIRRACIRFDGAPSLLRGSTTPFVGNRISLVMTNGSSYLLSLFAGAQQVGFFGAAERLASAGLALMQPAGQVLVPTITTRLSNHESTADAYRLMRKGTILTTGFGMGCLVGALVLSPYLIPLILGPGYEPSIHIMQIFRLMYPLRRTQLAIRSYVLLPLRQDSQILKATVVGAASSLIVIFLLAGNYQGAAWEPHAC
jgi:O-antigen/teichoic acid export membrane protein